MFQATRRRLALWYTVVTAVLLLLVASGFYFYVRHTLIDRVDDTLKHVVEVLERSILIGETHPPGEIVTGFSGSGSSQEATSDPPPAWTTATANLDDDHIDIDWFSAKGVLRWSTSLQTAEIPLHPQSLHQTVYLLSGYGLRQLTRPVCQGDHLLGYLRVSHPWFEVTKPIRQLLQDLGMGVVILLVSTAALGWFLSGLAMQPVWASFLQLKQFTADASHELRSPIASIQTNVQVALTDSQLDPSTRQSWQVVERLTQRLARLVDDLLFLARQDSGIVETPAQACSLDEILFEVVEEQQSLARDQGIHLSLHIMTPSDPVPDPEDPFQLWGMTDQLARLFTNLIHNALQYSLRGGEVNVTLTYLRQLGISYLQVMVKDSGIGIAAQDLPHVFDRFYRADPARTPGTRGSGLGLAIARSIVERHQGRIWVESTLGEGTTVTTLLPCSPPE
ncbi:MAG: HAMP domain-containing histidine kinase [Synechococcaceae cyanobacterium SM2_3_1]|nr:HAMP domain-containing histidine kinase [Synechococcaceae cyanobacterium SM2_3_1]